MDAKRWLARSEVRALAVATLCASLLACAKGDEIIGSGGAGGGAGNGTAQGASDPGGASSSGGAGGDGVGPGGNATQGGGGGGPACSESPCKLVAPQCGCGADEKCTIDAQGDRSCVADGTEPSGAQCTAGADCAAGGICLGGASVGYCASFCAVDGDCGQNICAVKLGDGLGGTIDGVTMCSSSCDPGSGTGCPGGLGCVVGQEAAGAMRFFFMCFEAGAVGAGGVCTTAADCQAGFGCYNNGTNNVCYKNCNVASPNCPGQTCYALTDQNMNPVVVGNYQLGVCQ